LRGRGKGGKEGHHPYEIHTFLEGNLKGEGVQSDDEVVGHHAQGLMILMENRLFERLISIHGKFYNLSRTDGSLLQQQWLLSCFFLLPGRPLVHAASCFFPVLSISWVDFSSFNFRKKKDLVKNMYKN
jgi:hypothetical protein